MKKNDIKVILIICICLLIFFFIWKSVFSSKGYKVLISVNNEKALCIDLQNNCNIQIKSDGECIMLKDAEEYDGTGNLLIIENGQANMVSADCPDKICVGMPAIQNTDESIVCMPNKVIVTVQ